MNYRLNITDIKFECSSVVAELINGDVLIDADRFNVPVEAAKLFKSDEVVSEVHGVQWFVRSMMLLPGSYNYRYTLEPTDDKVVINRQYKYLCELSELPYLDSDFLHGEFMDDEIIGTIPMVEVNGYVQYKDQLKVIIHQEDINRYNGRLHLLVEDILMEHLEMKVMVNGI